jgi:small subunit ribosomal protein S20
MPNIKSAKKRLRQSIVRRTRNRAAKSSLKSQIKKLTAAIAAKDIATAETLFVGTQKKLDQAAAKKIIHRNAAARVKSRLSAKIKALKKPVA